MIVTERSLRYQETNTMLRDAGYQPLGRLRLSRYQMLAVLTLAVNQIGWLTNRLPYRVYQAIVVRLHEIAQGTVACPSRQGKGRAGEHQDAEQLHVFCPCCGADLLAAGPVGPAEIMREVKARQSLPQKSPHSAVDEVENIPCEGKKKEGKRKVRGGKGTGGGDLAGRG